MATAEQYAEWIVANQDKQGTPEFETVAGAYKLAKSAAPIVAPAEKKPVQQFSDDMDAVESAVKNTAKGAAVGLADIGNTVLNSALYLPGKAIPQLAQWNRSRNADMDYITEKNKDSAAFSAGRIGANIAGTWPVGGMLGAGVKSLSAVPAAQALGSSIASGGFNTGLKAAENAPMMQRIASQLQNIGTRVAGGGVTGGASTALISPEDAGTGAMIGAALPPAIQGIAAAGRGAGRMLNSVGTSENAKLAQALMQAAEADTPEKIAAIRAALSQQGPSMIPGLNQTVPQILQMPGVSQLQRTVKSAGDTSLLNREIAQNGLLRGGIDRISPVTGTVQQSAENMGNAVQNFAKARNTSEKMRVDDLYRSIDPNDQTRFLLPIDEMQAAKEQFLGRGTFGAGKDADAAIRTAQEIGTETVEAAKQMTEKKAQDLVMAVRAAGGINMASKSGKELSGEIKNLKEAGLNNMVRSNGKSIERLAEQMHEAGFIPDNDPVTLLNHLQDAAGGQKIYPSGQGEDQWARLAEMAQGDAPIAGTFAKPVTYQELQNLRSSIGEAASAAQLNGRNKEFGALSKMIADIDSGVNKVASGKGQAGELFDPVDVQRWRDANAAHAARLSRFETGPQASMFRNGADGQASIQGAELAGKFMNAGRSQVEDAQAFQRLIGDSPALLDSAKNYLMTDLAGQGNQYGKLSNVKVGNWMNGRSGVLRETLTDSDNAMLRTIKGQLNDAGLAEDLGRASGSNTVQNAQNALRLGLLDNPFVSFAAKKTPIIGQLAGPALDALRETAKKSKAEKLAAILLDPAKANEAIGKSLKAKERDLLIEVLLNGSSGNAIRRAYPALLNDQ